MLIISILGIIFGSFVNAWVWRVYQQSLPKAKQKKKVDLSIAKGRSVCVHCGHVLAQKDLVPVLSWLSLRGRCRYCQKPISWQYPAVELVTGAVFALAYTFWSRSLHSVHGVGGLDSPQLSAYITFGAFLALIVTFMALTVYDIRWMLLPNRMVAWGAVFAGVIAVSRLVGPLDSFASLLLQTAASIAVAGGIFFILFYASNGRWIGGGDVKLGFVIGLLLGNPVHAGLMLFIASVLGTIFALPAIFKGDKTAQSKIPFGPFLIVGTIVTYLFGTQIIAWYLAVSGLSAL